MHLSVSQRRRQTTKHFDAAVSCVCQALATDGGGVNLVSCQDRLQSRLTGSLWEEAPDQLDSSLCKMIPCCAVTQIQGDSDEVESNILAVAASSSGAHTHTRIRGLRAALEC